MSTAAGSAARRVSKSAVEWAKFAQKVPKEELSNFQFFKAQSDHYVARVQSLPESLPAIDWASYKKRAPAMASILDQLQKEYDALKIPYPAGQQQLSAIDKQEKEQAEDTRKWVEESMVRVKAAEKELTTLNNIPPLVHLQPEEWNHYFPGTYRDPKTHPYFYGEPEPEADEIVRKYQSDYDFKMHRLEEH